jgi:hypothetical protein
MREVLGIALGAALFLPSVAQSQTYRTARLEVVQEVIDRGGTADLVGQVLSPDLDCVAGREVILYFDAADDVQMDETVATLTTDEGGSFFHAHVPATGGEYRAFIDEGDGCAAAESNYTALRVRADIELEAQPRSIVAGEPVTLTVTVDPFCEFLDELGVPVAELRIERLSARSGWVAIRKAPRRIGGCTFRLRRKPGRTTVYRAVGEGSFTALPRYENYFVGNISTPVLVEVEENQVP